MKIIEKSDIMKFKYKKSHLKFLILLSIIFATTFYFNIINVNIIEDMIDNSHEEIDTSQNTSEL